MPLAEISGRGERRLAAALELAPQADERILLVGARDLDPEEERLLAGSTSPAASSPPPDRSQLLPPREKRANGVARGGPNVARWGARVSLARTGADSKIAGQSQIPAK